MDTSVSGLAEEEGAEPQIEFDQKIEGRRTRSNKLEALDCWPEVKNMLETQVSVKDIVYHIQEVRQEYLEVKAESLRVTIYQWIQRHGHKLDDTRIPTKHLSMLSSVKERVDPLDALNMLFALQVDRIMLDYVLEKKNRRQMNTNNNSMRLAMEMVRTMSQLSLDKFKHRSYLNPNQNQGAKETYDQIERVRQQYREKFGDTAAAVALNPESRRKVFNALQKIRKGDTEPMLKLMKINEEKLKQHQEELEKKGQ